MTPTELCYKEAGKPAVDDLQSCDDCCATCGQRIYQGVHQNKINNPTFSQHGDFLRGAWVCPACTYMYRQGKAKPGNYVAVQGQGFSYLAISEVGDKKSWYQMLLDLAQPPAFPRA